VKANMKNVEVKLDQLHPKPMWSFYEQAEECKSSEGWTSICCKRFGRLV